jgi:hypothetical protein
MKKPYINPFRAQGWIKFMASAAMLAFVSAAAVETAYAQEGSQGNTYIFNAAEMDFFGTNHSFLTGGGSTLPGIVGAQRGTAGGGFGVLGYADPALTTTGANDANHVDGYVRKYSTTAVKFVFPVGDNSTYRPFAANPANLVTGAYFRADPGVAVTSDLGGGSYGPLPLGLTFPTTSKGPSVTTVLNKGYWDIDGATASRITLSWDNVVVDDITTLTSGALSKLTIAGWNPTTNRWERIASTLDVTSLYGAASTLTQGSITSNAAIVPSSYTVYTLAAATPDLTPTITVIPSVIGGITPITIKITVVELNSIATDGSTITLNTRTSANWTIGITPGSVINGWTYVGVVGVNHRFTSNLIFKASTSVFQFPATFNPLDAVGQFTFNIAILSNSGGESPNTNNTDQESVSYEP